MFNKYKFHIFFCFILFSSTVPSYAVNDVVTFGSYSPGTVQVLEQGVTFTVSTAQYIQGVLSGEIGSWDTTNNQKAFTALAIAALTFLQQYNNNNIDSDTNQPFPIPGTTAAQVWNTLHMPVAKRMVCN